MQRITLAVALLLVMLSPALRADTLRTFSLSASNMDASLNGLVVINTTTGQALYGYADLTLSPYPSGSPHAPLPEPIVISGGGIISNGGCFTDCLEHPNEHELDFSANGDPDGGFYLHMMTPDSLVNYMGGDLCYMLGLCGYDAYTYAGFTANYPSVFFNGVQQPAGSYYDWEYFFNAHLTYVSAVSTPEPSSLILLGSGALGLVGAFRRRFLNL